MPWVFCKYLQDTFKVKLWFQLTDDEKFMFYDHLTLEETKKWGYENALDIIALGFDPNLTNIFLDTEYIKTMYTTAIRAAKKINFSTIRAVFGFDNQNNIGSIFFTSIQITVLVATDAARSVLAVEILAYREAYGGDVRRESWRRQFVGLGPGAPMRWGREIRNISGATISARSVTRTVSTTIATLEAVVGRLPR